jgi:hypothetical protein
MKSRKMQKKRERNDKEDNTRHERGNLIDIESLKK